MMAHHDGTHNTQILLDQVSLLRKNQMTRPQSNSRAALSVWYQPGTDDS